MAKKTHGLGRGLDILLPDADLTESELVHIAVLDIDPNPDQPRQSFTEASLDELAASIREQGVLQPLLVTASSMGRYRIVAGERRWRAARKAGLDTVPCLVREMTDSQEKEIALIENLQREDLNPVEEAIAIRSLMEQFGYTQDAAAKKLGRSRPAVANLLRLLNLPQTVLDMVKAGTISAGHARVLAGLNDEAEQLAYARLTVDKALSVRQLEELAASANKPKQKKAAKPALTVELQDLQSRVLKATGLKTVIRGSEKKGRITLEYRSAAELEAFYEMIARMDEE